MKNKTGNEEFKEMRYILTSTMRTKLIISLYDKTKNIQDLRNELDKPSATILHGLKELENLSYVKKLNKYYSLTSNGHILAVNLIKLIENWYSIKINKQFWDSHDLSGIPKREIQNIYKLKNSEYVSSTTTDLSKALTSYMELIEEAENLKIMLPVFSEIHIDKIMELLKSRSLKELEIITTEDVFHSIENHPKYKTNLLNNESVRIHVLRKNELKLFLSISSKFSCLTLFFNDGHYDDSQMLIDRTEEGLEWSNNLFDHYKELSDKNEKC